MLKLSSAFGNIAAVVVVVAVKVITEVLLSKIGRPIIGRRKNNKFLAERII